MPIQPNTAGDRFTIVEFTEAPPFALTHCGVVIGGTLMAPGNGDLRELFGAHVVGDIVLRAEHQRPAFFEVAQPQGDECRQIAKLVLDDSQTGDDSRTQNTLDIRGHGGAGSCI